MMSDDLHTHVRRIERPLESARRLGDALALITEAVSEPEASAVNEVVHILMDRLQDIMTGYGALFRLTHPSRERFEKDGWPGGSD